MKEKHSSSLVDGFHPWTPAPNTPIFINRTFRWNIFLRIVIWYICWHSIFKRKFCNLWAIFYPWWWTKTKKSQHYSATSGISILQRCQMWKQFKNHSARSNIFKYAKSIYLSAGCFISIEVYWKTSLSSSLGCF